MYNNDNNENINNNNNLETGNTSFSNKNIEKIIHKYAKTGTATRRMDGIVFKINDEKNLEMKYLSGLNCSKKTLSCPIHKKAFQNKGDSGEINDTSI